MSSCGPSARPRTAAAAPDRRPKRWHVRTRLARSCNASSTQFSRSRVLEKQYVDLTVVWGYGQGVLIVTGLVMLGIALAVFG
jgi:hypothetical protein